MPASSGEDNVLELPGSGDNIRTIGEESKDGDSDDEPGFLSSRALQYQRPVERRGTFQRRGDQWNFGTSPLKGDYTHKNLDRTVRKEPTY